MVSIEEFVALRPKQYSYVTEDDEVNRIFKKEGILMKDKGLSKTSTSRYITHQMYVDQADLLNAVTKNAWNPSGRAVAFPSFHRPIAVTFPKIRGIKKY